MSPERERPKGWTAYSQKTDPGAKTLQPPVEKRIPMSEILDSVERLVEPPGKVGNTYSSADTVNFDDPDADLVPATLQSELEGGPTIPDLQSLDTDVSNPSQGRRNAEAMLRMVGILRTFDRKIDALTQQQMTHPRLVDFEGRLHHVEHRVDMVSITLRGPAEGDGKGGLVGVLHSHGQHLWGLLLVAVLQFVALAVCACLMLGILVHL